jgi:hypothetical protein
MKQSWDQKADKNPWTLRDARAENKRFIYDRFGVNQKEDLDIF